MSVFIAEVKLYKIIKQMIELVKTDYNQNSDKKNTILYNLFAIDEYTGEAIQIERFNYFEQAKSLFLKDIKDTRVVSLNVGFNIEKASFPCLHVMMPSETPINAPIGMNSGYVENEQNQEFFVSDSFANYNVLITSDNMGEVIILYHFLKALFLVFQPNLENDGFQNLKFGGTDLQLNQDFVPPNIFFRNFTLNFTFDYSVKSLYQNKTIKKIFINSAINEPNATT